MTIAITILGLTVFLLAACKSASDATPTVKRGTPTLLEELSAADQTQVADGRVRPIGILDPVEALELARATKSLGHQDATVARAKEGVFAYILGMHSISVGQSDRHSLSLANRSRQHRPEAPFIFTVSEQTLLASGPIALDGATYPVTDKYDPGLGVGGGVNVTCDDVGSAVLTWNVRGDSEITDPPSPFSVTVDFPIECVANPPTATPTPPSSESVTVPAIAANGSHVPVSTLAIAAGTECVDLAWMSLFEPAFTIEREQVFAEELPECGLGTVEDTEIVFLEIGTDEWQDFCRLIALETPDLTDFVYPSCGSGSDSGDDDSGQAPSPTTTTERKSGELVLLHPCDAVSKTIVESILGNPVEFVVTDTGVSSILVCDYSSRGHNTNYFWRGSATLVGRALSETELRRQWIRDNSFGGRQDYIVYADANGILDDLVEAGFVVPERSDHEIKVYRSAEESKIGDFVLMSRNSIRVEPEDDEARAGQSWVEVLVRIPGYDMYLEVRVMQTEPYDPQGITNAAQREAFYNAMPPIAEYEWRVLELAGFVARAVELAQLEH